MIFFLNFVFPGLFGHNLGPLKKKKNENIFFGRLGKSTSIRAIDLAVQHTKLVNFCDELNLKALIQILDQLGWVELPEASKL